MNIKISFHSTHTFLEIWLSDMTKQLTHTHTHTHRKLDWKNTLLYYLLVYTVVVEKSKSILIYDPFYMTHFSSPEIFKYSFCPQGFEIL